MAETVQAGASAPEPSFTPFRFTRRHGRYQRGDVVGLDPSQAEIFAARGFGVKLPHLLGRAGPPMFVKKGNIG